MTWSFDLGMETWWVGGQGSHRFGRVFQKQKQLIPKGHLDALFIGRSQDFVNHVRNSGGVLRQETVSSSADWLDSDCTIMAGK